MNDEKDEAQDGLPPAPLTAPPVDGAPEQEQPPIPVDKVFGMPRSVFHCTALGIAFGFIAAGVFGLVTHIDVEGLYFLVGGGVIGWLLGKFLDKKRRNNEE